MKLNVLLNKIWQHLKKGFYFFTGTKKYYCLVDKAHGQSHSVITVWQYGKIKQIKVLSNEKNEAT